MKVNWGGRTFEQLTPREQEAFYCMTGHLRVLVRRRVLLRIWKYKFAVDIFECRFCKVRKLKWLKFFYYRFAI